MDSNEDDGCYSITWSKLPLGFSLVQEKTGRNAFISSIDENKTNKGLKLASQIIKVNERTVEDKPHSTIKLTIKFAELPLTIKFREREDLVKTNVRENKLLAIGLLGDTEQPDSVAIRMTDLNEPEAQSDVRSESTSALIKRINANNTKIKVKELSFSFNSNDVAADDDLAIATRIVREVYTYTRDIANLRFGIVNDRLFIAIIPHETEKAPLLEEHVKNPKAFLPLLHTMISLEHKIGLKISLATEAMEEVHSEPDDFDSDRAKRLLFMLRANVKILVDKHMTDEERNRKILGLPPEREDNPGECTYQLIRAVLIITLMPWTAILFNFSGRAYRIITSFFCLVQFLIILILHFVVAKFPLALLLAILSYYFTLAGILGFSALFPKWRQKFWTWIYSTFQISINFVSGELGLFSAPPIAISVALVVYVATDYFKTQGFNLYTFSGALAGLGLASREAVKNVLIKMVTHDLLSRYELKPGGIQRYQVMRIFEEEYQPLYRNLFINSPSTSHKFLINQPDVAEETKKLLPVPREIGNRGGSNDRSGREVPSLTPQRVPAPVNALTRNQVLGNIANEIDPFQYAVYGEDNSNSETLSRSNPSGVVTMKSLVNASRALIEESVSRDNIENPNFISPDSVPPPPASEPPNVEFPERLMTGFTNNVSSFVSLEDLTNAFSDAEIGEPQLDFVEDSSSVTSADTTREIELKDRQTEIRSLLQNFRWGGDSDSSVDDSSTRTGTKKSRSSRGFSLKPMPTKPTTGEACILDTWLPAVLFPKPATKSYNAVIMDSERALELDLVGLHLFDLSRKEARAFV